MGGSILFTQSTNFDPQIYGLIAGKFINYIVVGGGGAGGSCGSCRYWNGNREYDYYDTHRGLDIGGTNGGTSSIGTYVTATGGITGKGDIEAYLGEDVSVPYCDGGSGGYGWIPGRVFSNYSQGSYPRGINSSSSASFENRFLIYEDGNYRIVKDRYSESGVTSYPKTSGASSMTNASSWHSSWGVPNPYSINQSAGVESQGNDGIGYGAGGGGHIQYDSYPAIGGMGGDGGQFKMGSFKLENTNPIPITIGDGGTPHTKNQSMETHYGGNQYYSNPVYSGQLYGRNGTHGAVMLFWD